MDENTYKYEIIKTKEGPGFHSTTEYAIRNREMSVCSRVIDVDTDPDGPAGRMVWVSTSASGRLTVEQADAYVEMIQRAIEDAKWR